MTDFAAVEHALTIIREGGMVVLVDDKDRENEGDLVIAAEHCRAQDVNFMCTRGRGLVCLALTGDRIAALKLPMMVPTRPGDMGTAFTVSIEARQGVTTGISAADRARTIAVAADPEYGAEDLVSPGHIFPLRGQPGGVLARSGHTEGAIDLARLAGLRPAGVICEIMRDDGDMARMPELERFAARHGLPILTIADLIEYRLQRESLIEEVVHAPVASAALGVSEAAGWVVRTFRATVESGLHYVALCKGDVGGDAPVLLRAQRARVLGDVFGFGSDSGRQLRAALRQIDNAGRGMFLYVIHQGQQGVEDLVSRVAPFRGEDREGKHLAPGLKEGEEGLRQFGVGAQVLKALGVRRIKILTNHPRKIVAVRGFGIEVCGTVPLEDGQ